MKGDRTGFHFSLLRGLCDEISSSRLSPPADPMINDENQNCSQQRRDESCWLKWVVTIEIVFKDEGADKKGDKRTTDSD